MPLEIYKRGSVFWVKGWVEYNGRPIAGPYRQSTRATTEAGARDWINEETALQIHRHVVGEERVMRFADAVEMYHPTPQAAKQLLPILDEIGDMPISKITGALLKRLGPKLKPMACTDTWWREIVPPARAVINNAHDLKGTPAIRVRRYDRFEWIAQDQRRKKASRVERTPATRDWIEAFCAAADPYNAALVRFMFETAARIDQAVCVEPGDLNPLSCEVMVKAQKGHPEGLVTVSPQMMAELVALKPKRPRNRKTGALLSPRVFGYGSPTGYNNRWKTICKRAGIPYLSAHRAGRHSFYTELVVRQGVDPVTAAKAGRWSDATLPMRIYAHAEADEAEVRARFRTNYVQPTAPQAAKHKKTKKDQENE